MKVTVNFGRTGVVVPCKDGWIVRDLIEQATQRYRKIVEQDGEVRVRTHHVEYADGGILDPDDVLTDLVEDRDKLIAVFEEHDVQQRAAVSPGGSVVSGRSSSPDRPDPELSALMPTSGSEIEVTSSALKSNTPLLVRSSSDSALATPLEIEAPEPSRHSPDSSTSTSSSSSLQPPATGASHVAMSQPQSRGGAMERVRNPKVTNSSLTRTVELLGDRGPLGIKVVPYCSSLSGRSLGLHVSGLEDSGRAKREGIFQEEECIVQINDTPLMDKSFAQSQEVFRQAMTSSSPVRLEVLPVSNKLRYEKTLIGQLVGLNDGSSVESFPKTHSPLLLRPKVGALRENPETPPRSPEVPARAPATVPAPVPAPAPAPLPAHVVAPATVAQAAPVRAPSPQREEPPARYTPDLPRSAESTPPRAASASPTSARGRSESPLSKKGPPLSTLVNLANKKGGKKMKIDLKKGTDGLGFTVVTRDSSVHGPGPILVKSILPKGAAIKDGRLQSGDRILEVNGMDITGRTQEELVAMLRSTKLGETVSMVVARQEEIFLPRELKGEPTGMLQSEEGREKLMFEVPLSDSGSAGLGVSLKGNKSRETGEDLGIFIKSIIHGGAAYKDGRLRVNDQLVAINGESLVGRTNHDAMEALRRSMSMEGNLRGTIQLVVLRSLQPPSSPAQESVEIVSNQSLPPEASQGQPSLPQMVVNSIYDSAPASLRSSNGSYDPPEEDYDDEGFPPPPSHLVEPNMRPQPAYGAERRTRNPAPSYPYRQPEQQPQSLPNYNRNSKSMDLVPDESNVGSLVGPPAGAAAGSSQELGPGLGLQKSSSLESLQTAMAEVGKMEVPFHRPATHMVRGRGCNQSFRIAIDKSYDGPSEPEDDETDESSGRDTPSRELDDGNRKKKKKKDKKKEKNKSDDPEKKTKRKFGLLRFGKKNKDKSKGKLEALSEEELDRKTEGSRSEVDSPTPDQVLLPDVEDDDLDPNYARINNFRQPPPAVAPYPPYQPRDPSPNPAHIPSHSRESSSELEGLYAKVNKQRAPPQSVTDSNGERMQQIRRDLQHMRSAPAYDEVEGLRQPVQDYDPTRMPVSGPDTRMAPRYEDIYSNQRRMPAVDDRVPQHWSPKREPARYPAPAPHYNPQRETYQLNYPPSSYPLRESYSMPDSYPARQPQGPGSPRLPMPRSAELERRYRPSPAYPSPPPVHRVPLQRQDVPPSPTLPLRNAPRYEQVGRAGYRTASPDRYGAYGEASAHPQDPRQKNSGLIGAV